MKTAIIIPARYGSTRFPGKPLALIHGRSMIAHVIDVARAAAAGLDDIDVYVTTEDARIHAHVVALGAACIMTDNTCKTGSDRALAAARQLEYQPDFIMNLQGDAPFTPPAILRDMMTRARADKDIAVITPVHRLSWDGLDNLHAAKTITPFSGTTAVVDNNGRALWFSKNILPAIRKEDRTISASPVYQHIGLYGYTFAALEQFCALPEGRYEALEGLEQLRFLEHGIPIQTISVDVPNGLQAGIDSPEDLERANKRKP